MGTVYNIPHVVVPSFTNTGYGKFDYNSLNAAQREANNIIVNNGIRFATYEWIATDGYNNYLGFYISGNVYYAGYSYVDGISYTAYREDDYAYVNHAVNTQGVYISDSAHSIAELPSGVDIYNSRDELYIALSNLTLYPITYSYTNSAISGPSEATIGDTVIVSAVPDVDYGITDPTTQIAVTNNDAPVNFTWDAATNRITFTMPDPT